MKYRTIYNEFYKQFHTGKDCYYCGLRATTIDHVPSLCVIQQLGGVAAAQELGIRALTVNCCSECNSLLGARPLTTLTARKAWLKVKIKQRYRHALSTPNWTPEELAQLGHSLRSKVVAGIALKELIVQRLNH